MEVRATAEFQNLGLAPTELNYIPKQGETFFVSQERFEVLRGNNPYNRVFVESVDGSKVAKPKKKRKPKKQNKIGIIIPNCNYEDWIEKCLNSILTQTYQIFEIVFVDDVSTDNSVEIAKRLLKKPHKVIELKQKRLNGGARNEALLHLSNDVDYVWYVDSDDWLKDKLVLEKINAKLVNQPDVLFVGMSVYKGQKESTLVAPEYNNRYDAIQGWSGSCGAVIRKDLAMRQECLFADGTLKEDKNHHCRICIYMDDFDCLKESVYIWNRTNAKSVTTSRDKTVWGTSTIRHYADTLQLYYSVKGNDAGIDRILEQRIKLIKQELFAGGDRQF